MENRRYRTGTSLDPIVLDDDEDDFNDTDIATHAQAPTLAQGYQLPTRSGPSSGISSNKIASNVLLRVGSPERMQTHTAGRGESHNASPADCSTSVRRKDASVQNCGMLNLGQLIAVTETDHKIQVNRANTHTGTAGPTLTELPESNKKRQMDLSAEKILQESRRLLKEETDSISEAEIESCLLKHLTLLHERHAAIVKGALEKSRMSLSSYFSSSTGNAQTIDPFADMPSVALGGDRTDEGPDANKIKIISFKSSTPLVPFNRRHLYYSQSVLAENIWKLDAIPYLDDGQHTEESKRSLFEELADKYDVSDIENRSVDALREQRYTFYRSCVEALFEEVNINWELILIWFLSPSGRLHRIFSSFYHSPKRQDEFQECLRDRRECEESEELSKKEWERILSQLPIPSPRDLRTCALVCKIFKKHRFSMWELARQSEPAERCLRNTLPNADNAVPSKDFECLEEICGICFAFDCLLHGERTEWPKPRGTLDSTSNSGAQDDNREEDEYVDTTIVDRVVNYRQIVNARLHTPSTGASKRFNPRHWLDTGDWEERENFIPCNHPGNCKEVQCSCFENRVLCEKTCNCASSCRRRYPGCSCAQNNAEPVCGMTTKCKCRQLNRECDADLCGRCGAAEVLDPVNRYKDAGDISRCCNVDIQRGRPRNTVWGQSKIHGVGLFTVEKVKKGDFLGEYTGDLVTIAEANRRGTTYPYQGNEYLFKLSQNQEIDATRTGSLVRFINCAPEKVANCEVRILLCNSVLRIGFFANRDLVPGTELTFDYRYPEEKMGSFVQPEDETSRDHISTASSPADMRSDVARYNLSARKSAGTKMSASSAGRPKASLSGENMKGARKSRSVRDQKLTLLGRVVNDTDDSDTSTNRAHMQSVRLNSSRKRSKPFEGGIRNDLEEDDDEYVGESPSESDDSYADTPSPEPVDSDNNEANSNLRPTLERPLKRVKTGTLNAGRKASPVQTERPLKRVKTGILNAERKASPVQTGGKTTLTILSGQRARKSAPRQPKHNLARGQKEE